MKPKPKSIAVLAENWLGISNLAVRGLTVRPTLALDISSLPPVAVRLFAEHAVTHYWCSEVRLGRHKFVVYIGTGKGNSTWLAVNDAGGVLFMAVDTTLRDCALCDLVTIMTDKYGCVQHEFSLADVPVSKDVFVAQIRYMFGLWFAGAPMRGESEDSPRHIG